MAYAQQSRPCTVHAGCTVLECVQDGRVVWLSHAPDSVHAECRAHPGHPLAAADGTALDSGREPCGTCAAYFAGLREGT